MKKGSDQFDQIITELQNQKPKKEEKTSFMSLSVLSQASANNYEDYKLINEYIEVFLKNPKKRKKLLKSQKLTKKVLGVLNSNDFSFINVLDLMKFCKIIIVQNYLNSIKFNSLVFQSFFKILQEYIGNPTFQSNKALKYFEQIISHIIQNCNTFSLKQKLFLAFAQLFKNNHLFYLENKKNVSQFWIFLFEMYLNSLQENVNVVTTTYVKNIGQKYIKQTNFGLVLFQGFKPAYLRQLLKKQKFSFLLQQISNQTMSLLKNVHKTQPRLLKIILDAFQVIFLLIRFPSIEKIIKLRKEILIQKYFELTILLIKFDQIEEVKTDLLLIHPLIPSFYYCSNFSEKHIENFKKTFSSTLEEKKRKYSNSTRKILLQTFLKINQSKFIQLC